MGVAQSARRSEYRADVANYRRLLRDIGRESDSGNLDKAIDLAYELMPVARRAAENSFFGVGITGSGWSTRERMSPLASYRISKAHGKYKRLVVAKHPEWKGSLFLGRTHFHFPA